MIKSYFYLYHAPAVGDLWRPVAWYPVEEEALTDFDERITALPAGEAIRLERGDGVLVKSYTAGA